MESSSKVTVTYWDPSSVFPLIENDLRLHLPLRNLHWKSPTRPLRSINTLHIELVPYTGNESTIVPPGSARRGSFTPSINSGTAPGLPGGSTAGGKRRRHQIPGLRNTPYLKLYILRCDDNDQYKSTSRKLIREWVSTHAAAISSSGPSGGGAGGPTSSLAPPTAGIVSGSSTKGDVGKQHDASEWLVIHVLLPGTAAYAQPRAQLQSAGAQPATRGWAGMKGTTTLLEKIRSDFNTSTKAGIKDRIIQLRIHPNHTELSLLSPPVPVAPHTLLSSPPEPKEETEASYQDLITKFKSQILSSFDLRVAQYEEDVRERDSQRMLPGWNFCTFFVLKEGLARAFESVGLVEDSLILYDELAIGLQEFLREEEERGKGALGIEDWTGEASVWVYKAQDRLRKMLKAVQMKRGEGGEERPLQIGTEVVESKPSITPGDAGDVGDGLPGVIMRGDNMTSSAVHETESEGNGAHDEETLEHALHENSPILSPYKKAYRDLILSNRISIFDFECYLFARQSNLLLRLGGATNAVVPTPTLPSANFNWPTHPPTAPNESSMHPTSLQPGEEDLKHLTSLLRRGLAFVTNIGRILRQDLREGWRRSNLSPNHIWVDKDEEGEKGHVIDNLIDDIVKNWMFSVCMQLLEQTKARGVPRDVLLGTESPIGTPLLTGLFPRRTTSLPGTPVLEHTTFSMGDVSCRPASIMVSGRGPYAPAPDKDKAQEQSNPSLEELCSARGDMLVLARSLVEGFGRRKGWMGKWGSEGTVSLGLKGAERRKEWLPSGGAFGMEDVSLGDVIAENEKLGDLVKDLDGIEVGCGVSDTVLRKAVDSEMGFYGLFEELTEMARRHFTMGRRVKSVERAIADLAALKFHLQDYRMAAHYLEKLTTSYSGDGWGLIETNLLTMYAKCLNKMNRREEYVRILLKLLAKAASAKLRWDWRRIATISSPLPHTPLIHQFPRDCGDVIEPPDIGEANLDVRGYVPEIISMSDKLAQHINSPMNELFTDILVEPYLRKLGDRMDGYKILVKFRYLLEEDLLVQAVKVRIVSMTGGLASREIWMNSPPSEDSKGIRICRGIQKIWLETNQNIPGTYIVDQFIISIHNISFVHEILANTTPATPVALTASNAAAAISAAKRSRLQFFPHPRSLLVQLRLPDTVYLDRGRRVEFVISTGWNYVLSAEMTVKSATAGLRMMMREVELLTHAHASGVALDGGKVKLKDIPPRTDLVLRVPYSAEREMGELGVRVEVAYTTETGEYVYAIQLNVTVALPLVVNVQDVFKKEVLFSKFQVSTALDVPLVILAAKLDGTGTGFVAESARSGKEAVGGDGWLVVPRQAGQFVYRIRKRKETYAEAGVPLVGGMKKPGALQLHITYRSLDEEVYSTVAGVLKAGLEMADLTEYQNLLLEHLKIKLDMRTVEELEVWGVVREVGLGRYEEWGWSEALEGIAPGRGGKGGERQRVESWLRDWWRAEANNTEGEEGELQERRIRLAFGSDMSNVPGAGITRALVIPVEVPAVDVVCTVEMKLFPRGSEQNCGEGYSEDRMLIAGAQIPAELRIRWSREWAFPYQINSPNTSRPDQPMQMEFSYHLIQPPPPPPPTPGVISLSIPPPAGGLAGGDTWLIAGRRRSGFIIPAGSDGREGEAVFQLVLIPLRTGAVPLPGVDIKAVPTGRIGGDSGQDELASDVVVETEYLNGGEVVHVVRDVRSVTVSIASDVGGVGGGGGEVPAAVSVGLGHEERGSVMGLGSEGG